MAVEIAPPKTHVTYEEYRALPEDGKRYEVIDGELVMTAAPRIVHQRILRNLLRIVDDYIQKHNWGEVLFSPVEVYLDEENFVEPDLVCVSREHQEIITENNIKGAPDLIVEILSPSTARYDRVRKLRVYAQHRVPHYWIVSPNDKTLEAFELENGAYKLVAALEENESFQPSLFPDLTISLADLWK